MRLGGANFRLNKKMTHFTPVKPVGKWFLYSSLNKKIKSIKNVPPGMVGFEPTDTSENRVAVFLMTVTSQPSATQSHSVGALI